MKSFWDHLNEQLLNEIGDTPAGREAIARYTGRAQKYVDQQARRAFQLFDRSKTMSGEKAERMKQISAGVVRSKRYNNRIRGISAAKKILKSAPESEVSNLNRIYHGERDL
jgi:hypothetical protein